MAACLRSLKLNAMANAVLRTQQFLVLMQRGAKERARRRPPAAAARVQRLTSEPVVKGRDAD